MKRILVITIFLLFLIHVAFSQESGQKNKRIKITSFSVSMGFAQAWIPGSLTSYNSLKNTVENPDLFIDPADFDQGQYYSNAQGNGSFRVNIGLTPYAKKRSAYRTNHELRFGIGGDFGSRGYYDFYKRESVTIDTFQSTSGNPDIYVDSVYNEGYTYDQRFFSLNFSISYLFKTDVKKRVFLYTGVGAEYGISLQNYVEVENIKTSTYYLYNSAGLPDYGSGYYPVAAYNSYGGSYISASEDNTDMIKATHFVRVTVPMGVNFRFSNNNSFFKHLNIYTELNPGVEFQIVANDKTYINPYLGVAMVGLNYKW